MSILLESTSSIVSEEIIQGPKKRGRKPKNQIPLNLKQTSQTIIEDKPLPKKRGRKPKNQLLNENFNELEIYTASETKILKKNSLKQNTENQIINTKIDVELIKELDLSSDSFTYSNNENINIESNIWQNKYQPKSLNEIIGNKENITKIKKWLNNYNNSLYHAAIISGGHGVGKNLIVKLALQECGYQIKNIYSTNLKNKNIVSEIIHSCVKTKNAQTLFNNTVNQKYAIVIDDTESITLTSEKDSLLELFKFNAENRYFPLIFINNLQHSKLINNLKKASLDIILYAPHAEHIKTYIHEICKKECMNIVDDKIYLQIIKYCQSDIRRLLFVLQDLYYTYSKKPITCEMFKEYQRMTQKKDIDIGLYLAAKKLLDNYRSVNDCLQSYETEKVLLPLTIYENYYKKIFKQKLTYPQILHIMSNITNSISIGDVIETNIYSDQNWFLQNIHGFYTCVETSYTMNNQCQYNKSKLSEEKTHQQIDYDLVFSADLNKTSSKNINKKKIYYHCN